MNIGFDAKRAFHNASGLGNYSRFVLRILAEHYPEHFYFLFNPKPSSSWNAPDYNNVREILPKKGSSSSFWRTFGGNKKVKEFDLNVYHGLSNELPFGISKNKTQKVVTIHDLIFMRYPNLYKSTDRIIYTQKFKYAAKSADKVIAISETTKKDIVDFLDISPSKIEVVYQGCDPIFKTKATEAEIESTLSKFGLPKEFLVCVGTIETRKNGLNILKALIENKIDTPVVFAGKKTNYQIELDAFIEKNPNLKHQVFFVEGASNLEIRNLYQAASISLYPSIFEGFGIPVLESINCGTPVITTKNGCFEEAGGKAAVYINPLDPASIGAAIETLLNSKDKIISLQEIGKVHTNQFDDKKLAADLMKVYKA